MIGSDRCLLDGSPVPSHNGYTRKMKDGQQTSYVVFTESKMKATMRVRPLQNKIRHLACLTLTEMHEKMAETISREPSFYKALFCAHCRAHFRIGAEGEFIWHNSDARVGT